MIGIQEATYQEEYRIWLRFNTGESGIADLADLLHTYKAAQPLLDKNEFKKFYLDEWPTLAWPCGFDLAPESLYERATGKQFLWPPQ
ncbi:MAG: DUF2442 domain-containing protein [Trichlorobacter sp.]|uniref:DUF2442 domain-containing protein n=1 Tax=Trichlorobacter sp. TaxID=2911007 RepID=UPI00255D6CB2|nr:DUF2442 domain-containing protein [Trichlorobacter sp.]MDK9719267.1 DUF2442 domain-containing protein [Trichlorobacter sp.]